MSTNKQSPVQRRRGVTGLPEVRKRRRLENLLYTRKRVAQLAAEYRSHGLDEHIELYLLQLEVEQVLADEFPAAFEVQIDLWADEEAAAEHHPLSVGRNCSLCQAIEARSSGGAGTSFAA